MTAYRTSIGLVVIILQIYSADVFVYFPAESHSNVSQGLHRALIRAREKWFSLHSNTSRDWNTLPEPSQILNLDWKRQAALGWSSLHLSSASNKRTEEPLPAELFLQSVSLNLAREPWGSQNNDVAFKPKPISVLMNFGIDGKTEWTSSNDDDQDNCAPGIIQLRIKSENLLPYIQMKRTVYCSVCFLITIML